MNYSILNTPNLVEFHGNTQILILSNSRELKRSIYADRNQSALRIHHSEFAYLRATHRQAAGAVSEQKETLGPLNCKRSRKGSQGQRREDGLASRFSQTLYTQNGLIPWINQLQQKWHKS